MSLDELILEITRAINRTDLSEYVDKAYIGEWIYGVSMVPCDWVLPYLEELAERRKNEQD